MPWTSPRRASEPVPRRLRVRRLRRPRVRTVPRGASHGVTASDNFYWAAAAGRQAPARDRQLRSGRGRTVRPGRGSPRASALHPSRPRPSSREHVRHGGAGAPVTSCLEHIDRAGNAHTTSVSALVPGDLALRFEAFLRRMDRAAIKGEARQPPHTHLTIFGATRENSRVRRVEAGSKSRWAFRAWVR